MAEMGTRGLSSAQALTPNISQSNSEGQAGLRDPGSAGRLRPAEKGLA
jgi:hypothetical protein